MKTTKPIEIALVVLLCSATLGWADEYGETIQVSQQAGESGGLFYTVCDYAVFPTIGKGGIGIGGAYGEGRV